jgi:hypothetical protein
MTVLTSITIDISSATELWSSPDLLRRCKQHARRPATDTSVTDDIWYDWMTEAQTEVFHDLFSRYPALQTSAAILMTSSDGGYTYTFGTDIDGDPLFPMGFAEIFPNLRSIPDSPLVPGSDYEVEGYLIRIPNGRTRTFADGPYARFVTMPDQAVNDDTNPLLYPKEARILLVWKALASWARRSGSGADPNVYEAKYQEGLNRLWIKLATTFNTVGPFTYRWWSGPDLLVSGQLTG